MPLSFASMPRGAFTGYQMIFLFLLSLLPEAESECRVCQPASWMKQAVTHSRTNREEWLLPPGWTSSVGTETIILPLSWFALFTLPVMSFSFWWFLFYGFSPEVFSTQSASGFVYLHFAPFSEPHQSVIFVQGAKVIPGLDGKARSSLLFSAEISSPSGSISPKNLAFPNPYLFKHPKRKRPMRQKDA